MVRPPSNPRAESGDWDRDGDGDGARAAAGGASSSSSGGSVLATRGGGTGVSPARRSAAARVEPSRSGTTGIAADVGIEPADCRAEGIAGVACSTGTGSEGAKRASPRDFKLTAGDSGGRELTTGLRLERR